MKASLWAFMIAGLFLAPEVAAAIIENHYHFEGTFNEGLSYTLTFTSKPNSSQPESFTFVGTQLDENLRFPISVKIPAAPIGSKIIASGISTSQTIHSWDLDATVTPIQADCDGVPCPYHGVYTWGTPAQVFYTLPESSVSWEGLWATQGPRFAGNSYDLELWVALQGIEFVSGPFNATAVYTFSGPSTYSIDLRTFTAYEPFISNPEPRSLVLTALAIAGAGLLRSRTRS